MHLCAQWVLLPALTLAVLDERQLNELMFHEGRSHQLHTEQKIFRHHLSNINHLQCVYSVCVYLHGECVCERRNTLQGLVSTAASTSPHRHAGWDEEMVRLPRQLPPNLHQSVPRLTATPWVNLQPSPHWWKEINTVRILLLSLSQLYEVVQGFLYKHTFSTFPGFWGVCGPPVSELEGEIKVMSSREKHNKFKVSWSSWPVR